MERGSRHGGHTITADSLIKGTVMAGTFHRDYGLSGPTHMELLFPYRHNLHVFPTPPCQVSPSPGTGGLEELIGPYLPTPHPVWMPRVPCLPAGCDPCMYMGCGKGVKWTSPPRREIPSAVARVRQLPTFGPQARRLSLHHLPSQPRCPPLMALGLMRGTCKHVGVWKNCLGWCYTYGRCQVTGQGAHTLD